MRTAPKEKLFKVWDLDKQEWWVPAPREARSWRRSHKRMKDLWTRINYCQATIKDAKDAPQHYEIVEFKLVEVNND